MYIIKRNGNKKYLHQIQGGRNRNTGPPVTMDFNGGVTTKDK